MQSKKTNTVLKKLRATNITDAELAKEVHSLVQKGELPPTVLQQIDPPRRVSKESMKALSQLIENNKLDK
jgi:hypothetical protein